MTSLIKGKWTMRKYQQPSKETLILDDISEDGGGGGYEVQLPEEEGEGAQVVQLDGDEADDKDMRWQLTTEEKHAVKQLQQAADAEGLYYKNLFELAKYVLVVRSLEKTKDKRTDVALRRLRKRDAWMKKNHLAEIDAVQAHAELAQASCAQHFVQCFKQEKTPQQRAIICTHMAHVPLTYIQASESNRRKYLVAAMYRMDLGAVDLNEARNGMAVAQISQGQLSFSRAWKYMRFMNCIASDMKDMHPHTVKAVHAQFPSIVAHMLPAIKHVLPRKVAERIHAYASVDEMSKALEMYNNTNVDTAGDNNLNAGLTPTEWARQRQARYDATVAKLSLDS